MPEPLAIYSAVNTTWGLSKEIYTFVKAIVKAEEQQEAIWLRLKFTSVQIEFFVHFFKEFETSLEDELASTLRAVIEKINASLEKNRTKLKKYSSGVLIRGCWPVVGPDIDEAEKSLAEWLKRMTDMYTFLPDSLKQKAALHLVRLPSERAEDPIATLKDYINMALKQKNSTEKELLDSLGTNPPDDSDSKTYYWRDTIDVPEWIQNNETESNLFKLEVAKLAEVLKLAQSNLIHVPQASSWFPDKFEGRNIRTFGIAYKIPDTLISWPPKNFKERTPTLKDLVKYPAEHPLNLRTELAMQLTRAIAFIHGLGWVHKTIRSDNVLLVYGKTDEHPPTGLGQVNLKGFRIARRAATDAQSTNSERENVRRWYYQVYVHPKRQMNNLVEESKRFEAAANNSNVSTNASTLSPSGYEPGSGSQTTSGYVATPWENLPRYEFYKFKHDIYSLGVVLLELGLWVDLTPRRSQQNPASPSSSSEKTAEPPKTRTDLTQRLQDLERLGPEARMNELIKITNDHLAKVMGQRYLDVVLGCLSVDTTKWNVQRVLEELSKIQL